MTDRDPEPAAIVVEDVHKSFGDRRVLKGISFRVETGETLCILGGSGDDTVYGGDGEDEVYGQLGDDTIYGGLDNDVYTQIGLIMLIGLAGLIRHGKRANLKITFPEDLLVAEAILAH